MRQGLESTSPSANGFTASPNGQTGSSLRKASIAHALNGHSSPAHSDERSVTHANGTGKSAAALSTTYFGHDREEITRLLIQSLHDLGYSNAASTLVDESGYQLESPSVAAFREAVLQGKWSEAEEILLSARSAEKARFSDKTANQGMVLAENAERGEMLFALRKQKFLELLEQRDLGDALLVLRQEITPLDHDVGQLHALTSLLMCPTEELRTQTGWVGSVSDSRQRLLSELSKSISPSVMIPDRRLAVLLDQVKTHQINDCFYHNTAESPSLYADHKCDRNIFPSKMAIDLQNHTDEVWFLQFSHDGTKLASASKDRMIYIYETRSFSVLKKFSHQKYVAYLAWSPDDTKLISCAHDRAQVWDVETGQFLQLIDQHREPVTTATWAPDGQSFVTASLERRDSTLCLWNLQGRRLHKWSNDYRVQDCAITPDGQRLVVVSTEKGIFVYDFNTREEEYRLDLKINLTCLTISRDSKQMLVNVVDNEIHLLDIETATHIKTFRGQKQGQFVIRSSFGGAAENFVISGSEDGKVYIWHKGNGQLVESLDGHTVGCVNAVSWNPRDPGMFASAGDDCRVRIWLRDPALTHPLRQVIESKSSTGHNSDLTR